MSAEGELEYTKLLDSNAVMRELIEHPQFYNSFISKYDELSSGGDIPVEVSVDKDNVSILRRCYYPDATNGVYKGYQDIIKFKFSLQEMWDNKYFRVDGNSSMMYTFPQGNSLSNSARAEIYEDNALLGKAYFLNVIQGSHGLNPALGFSQPDLSTGYILNGQIPPIMREKYVGTYSLSVSGRPSYDHGIIRSANLVKSEDSYDVNFGLSAVNLSDSFRLDNAIEIATFDKDNNLTSLREGFSSVEEAKQHFQEMYSDAIRRDMEL